MPFGSIYISSETAFQKVPSIELLICLFHCEEIKNKIFDEIYYVDIY
jgi:hypothetical protein